MSLLLAILLGGLGLALVLLALPIMAARLLLGPELWREIVGNFLFYALVYWYRGSWWLLHSFWRLSGKLVRWGCQAVRS